MLLNEIDPMQSIFYLGAVLLKYLYQHHECMFMALYCEARSEVDMTIDQYILCLDWLYLINLVKLDEKGVVHLCS